MDAVRRGSPPSTPRRRSWTLCTAPPSGQCQTWRKSLEAFACQRKVSLLNGLPPLLSWGQDQRLNLAAAGQMASPLQAVWVGAVTIKQVFSAMDRHDWKEPVECVNNLKQLVVEQTQTLFPKMTVTPNEESSIVRLWFDHDVETVMHIKVNPTATVRQLQAAESKLTQLPFDEIRFADGTDGSILDPTTKVAGLSVCVVMSRKVTSPPSHVPIPELTHADLYPEEVQSAVIDPKSTETFTEMKDFGTEKSNAIQILPRSHLTDLVPPQVTDVKTCTTFRAQQIFVQDRLDVLYSQGGVMGDDEIIWHLQQAVSSVPQTAMLDPLLALGWLHHQNMKQVAQWIADHPDVNTVVTALWTQGHWTPIVWNASGSQLEVYLWDVHMIDTARFNPLHHAFCLGFEKPRYVVAHSIRSFCSLGYCGSAAIAFIRFRFKLISLPEELSVLKTLHEQFRQDFIRHLQTIVEQTLRPWCWGNGMIDATSGLVSILQQHGVPQKVAVSRAKLVMQSLGKDSVQHALEGGSPWKSLKALANSHDPPVRLVLQDELALNQQNKTTPKRKQTNLKPSVVRPADLNPSLLVLEPETFVDPSGQAMQQIPLAHVGPLASGVALASMADAQTFLKAGNVLTHGSLALLILHPTEDLPTPLLWSTVRFAAKCTANHEPLLLSGALVQLGKTPIAFNACSQPPLAQVEVACARVTVYQDQWEGRWEDFQARPVKLVLNKLLPLTHCKVDGCSCSAWHGTAGNGEAPSPLLDVFRRQFFTDAGRPVEWSKASYYAFSIRYNKEQETKLLQCSGLGGIFRAQD